MNIGYKQWHDGIGYDLAALDELTKSDRGKVEKLLIPRAANDWRDLEALDRLGTPRAVQAILEVRKVKDPEMRLRAHHYGPDPSDAEWENAIVFALAQVEPFAGLVLTMDSASLHPSPGVIEALLKCVREPGRSLAFHCAETLGRIAGFVDSPYDNKHRSLFMRFNAPDSEDRRQAIDELEHLCSKLT